MEAVHFRPTRAVLVFWVIWSVVACLPVGVIAVVVEIDEPVTAPDISPLGFILALIAILIVATRTILFFHSIRYDLDDQHITSISGILWKKRRSIPLEKITNLDVRQGPVERALGYGKIWIFTPSTGHLTPELKLIGVPKPNGMRDTILKAVERTRQSAAADKVEVAPVVGKSEDMVAILKDMRDSLKNIEDSLSGR